MYARRVMARDPYNLVRLQIDPRHGTQAGVEIDGRKYEPNTLFVVDPFTYELHKPSRLVRGIKQIEYPFAGQSRVRHFSGLRKWADMWLLSDGRNLTPVGDEAHLIDPDGFFYSATIDVFGAPNAGSPDVWPGPSVRALDFRPGQKLVCNVWNAPAEILVYEGSASAEYFVGGTGNRVRAHGDRAAVMAKDCDKGNTVRVGLDSEGCGVRSHNCKVKQNVFGSATGSKWLGDMSVVRASGRGVQEGKVNVCMDFIGRSPGGIRLWEEGWHVSGVTFDDFARGSETQKGLVIYDCDIGVMVAGGWGHTVRPFMAVEVARPVVDEDWSKFKQQIAAWDIALPEVRKNTLKEPSNYGSLDWLYASPDPKVGEVPSMATA